MQIYKGYQIIPDSIAENCYRVAYEDETLIRHFNGFFRSLGKAKNWIDNYIIESAHTCNKDKEYYSQNSFSPTLYRCSICERITTNL